MRLKVAGEATIGEDGAVSLPDEVLREVGWEHGDALWIDIVDGGRIVLSRAPRDIAAYFAGAFTDLYPDPDDTRRFLDEERAAWEAFDRRLDEPR